MTSRGLEAMLKARWRSIGMWQLWICTFSGKAPIEKVSAPLRQSSERFRLMKSVSMKDLKIYG